MVAITGGSTESRPTRKAGSRRLHPAAQHFRHAPGLGDAAAGGVRLARVEHFANRSDSIFVQMFRKTLEEFARGLICRRG